MILIDSRTGSGELVPLFKPYGIDVESTILDSGDLAWAGNGPDGAVRVGVERKRMNDLIQSMRDGRLAGRQIPRMHAEYSPGHIYLVVEGIWRCGDNGVLECYKHAHWGEYKPGVRCRSIMYREVASFLHSVQATMGVKVIKTNRMDDTVAEMVSLYHWYRKEWKDHKTAATIYAPEPEFASGTSRVRIGFRSEEAGLVERVAAQLPGIQSKAWEVGRTFGSVREMMRADVRRWAGIKGIGVKGAVLIVRAIAGTTGSVGTTGSDANG